MAQSAPPPKKTYEEYLALEAASEEKHEFLDGEIRATAGGTIEHGRLAINLGAELRTALAGKRCVVLSADVRIRNTFTRRTTYPDLSVVCGRREVAPDDRHAPTNPIVLAEVLSDATEGYDRGDKWVDYRRLPSLREYVLVSQKERRIDVFRRKDDGHWDFFDVGPGDTLELTSIGASIAVDAVYADPLAPEPPAG
jgi:Uma2 family endonuclease